jgi:hypothetical protein
MIFLQLSRLVANPTLVNNLLDELHKVAVAAGGSEYGLPIFDNGSRALLREAVYRWLLAQENPTPNTDEVTDSGHTYPEINAALQREKTAP